MTICFLVVGLEIKREIVDGHHSTRRAAALPMVAALGGTAPRGWAIPRATDIARAVGSLAVEGSGLPSSLRAFLLGLAIVDDIGTIVIVAVVFSTGLVWGGWRRRRSFC